MLPARFPGVHMLPRRRCPASSLLLPSVGGPTRSSAGTSPLAALCKDPAQLSRDAAVMASNATAISRASRAGQTGSQRRGPAVLTPTSGRPPTATIALYATCIVSGATPASTKSPLSTIPATWGRAYDGGCPPHNWLWDDIRQIDRGGGPLPMPAGTGSSAPAHCGRQCQPRPLCWVVSAAAGHHGPHQRACRCAGEWAAFHAAGVGCGAAERPTGVSRVLCV